MTDRAQALEAIQFHYDVGNPFYALWLDPRMVYSCAMWTPGIAADDLAGAQLAKLDYHLAQVRVQEARSLLDVGCGWGALLLRALESGGKLERAVGLTLSEEQHDHVAQAALQHPRMACKLENWLDHQPEQPYDGIVSIGAFEHFATAQDSQEQRLEKYRAFFRFCRDAMVRGGRLSLQTIAYLNMDRRDASQFMAAEIFPHSDLPYLSEVTTACEGILEITTVRNDRLDYARTCNLWLRQLKQQRAAAERVAGKEVVEKFEKYLALSSVGFHQGKLCLLRLTAQRT
ncbi:MAG: class I SAM-dependent methyltransferase [Pseudomonadota bacterium]